MATTVYDYLYYIEGDNIAVLQRTNNAIYSPDIYYIDDIYATPENADSDAILIEYSKTPAIPTAATDTLDVDYKTALAIVDYVKYRLRQDEGDEKRGEFYRREFLRRITENRNQRTGYHHTFGVVKEPFAVK